MLHGFIHPTQKKQTTKPKRKAAVKDVNLPEKDVNKVEFTIADLVVTAKNENMDIVQLLKEHMAVVEVAV